jgi:DNA mismatch endonuclease (patch repair protein)
MTDVHNTEQRRRNMTAVRGKDTKPELQVRSVLHKMGFRFRLYSKDLPGKPDIVLRRYKTVIFVNGCFWHRHDCKSGRANPKTRVDFWESKRTATVLRDIRNVDALKEMGWKVLTIWECQAMDHAQLPSIIEKHLGYK